MSTTELSATWLSHLEEKKQAINESFGQGYDPSGAVSTGRSFRTALEDFYKKRKEYEVSRLEAKLLPSYESITEICRSISHSAADLQDSQPKDTGQALFWRISFVLIEVSRYLSRPCIADQLTARMGKLELRLTLVAEINKKVPSFSAHQNGYSGHFYTSANTKNITISINT